MTTTTTELPAFDGLPYAARRRVMQMQQARIDGHWHFLLQVCETIDQAREVYARTRDLPQGEGDLISTDKLWELCKTSSPSLVLFVIGEQP